MVDAGWSSPVARQAHNLKVISSNLVPATKIPTLYQYLTQSPARLTPAGLLLVSLLVSVFGAIQKQESTYARRCLFSPLRTAISGRFFESHSRISAISLVCAVMTSPASFFTHSSSPYSRTTLAMSIAP